MHSRGREPEEIMENMEYHLKTLLDISKYIVYKDSDYDENNKKLKKLIHHVKHRRHEKVFKKEHLEGGESDYE